MTARDIIQRIPLHTDNNNDNTLVYFPGRLPTHTRTIKTWQSIAREKGRNLIICFLPGTQWKHGKLIKQQIHDPQTCINNAIDQTKEKLQTIINPYYCVGVSMGGHVCFQAINKLCKEQDQRDKINLPTHISLINTPLQTSNLRFPSIVAKPLVKDIVASLSWIHPSLHPAILEYRAATCTKEKNSPFDLQSFTNQGIKFQLIGAIEDRLISYPNRATLTSGNHTSLGPQGVFEQQVSFLTS